MHTLRRQERRAVLSSSSSGPAEIESEVSRESCKILYFLCKLHNILHAVQGCNELGSNLQHQDDLLTENEMQVLQQHRAGVTEGLCLAVCRHVRYGTRTSPVDKGRGSEFCVSQRRISFQRKRRDVIGACRVLRAPLCCRP